MTKTVALIITALMSLTILASPAGAARPGPEGPQSSATASCGGVFLKAEGLEEDQENTWSVRINGRLNSGTFGSTFKQLFEVPQVGEVVTWEAQIKSEDGTHNPGLQSGTVGPCGELARDAVAIFSLGQPGCNRPGELTYVTAEYATFSGTPSGTVGPTKYALTARASYGHAFVDGTKVKNYEGNLRAARDPGKCVREGTVVKNDRCGKKNDTFRVQRVRGLTYSVEARVLPEAVAIPAPSRRFTVDMTADQGYTLAGSASKKLRFTNRSC